MKKEADFNECVYKMDAVNLYCYKLKRTAHYMNRYLVSGVENKRSRILSITMEDRQMKV